MGNDTPIYVNNTQIEIVESYVCEESRPDGQQSPSTATCSRVILEHVRRDNLQLMRTFSNDVRRRNTVTHQSCKEKASNRTNKDGKEYVKHHIPGHKNKHRGKRKDKVHTRD